MKPLFINLILLFLVSNLLAASMSSVYPDQASPQQALKRAIVVGATSGIGRQVAKQLALEGYQVGLVGRREHLLKSLSEEIVTKTYQASIDVADHEIAADQLKQLIAQMGGLDLMVVSVSSFNDVSNSVQDGRPQTWEADLKTISVEAAGFYTAATVALDFFEQQKIRALSWYFINCCFTRRCTLPCLLCRKSICFVLSRKYA
jgi:NAD(P)-dependent dehydrogenase (short-subunit alcohol dehydrogenase family)